MSTLGSECQAYTHDGTRCTRRAYVGSKYCWQHQKINLQDINQINQSVSQNLTNHDKIIWNPHILTLINDLDRGTPPPASAPSKKYSPQ